MFPAYSFTIFSPYLSRALLSLSFSLKFRENNVPLEPYHSLTYSNILLITSSNVKDFSKRNSKDDRNGQAEHLNTTTAKEENVVRHEMSSTKNSFPIRSK
jgi:hypothetical protein